MQIALNVNRTRITVLGFNLALLFFLTSSLVALGRHYEVRAAWTFLPSFTHISVGFSLTVGAILLLVMSQRIDPTGSISLPWFSSGELLMYLALAQTLSGGLQVFVGGFVLTFREVPAMLGVPPEAVAEIRRAGESLTLWIHLLAAIVWFAATYFAPGMFIRRVPLSKQAKGRLALGYAVVLLIVFWVCSNAYYAHARARGDESSRLVVFVEQAWQPRLWRNPSLPGKQVPPKKPDTVGVEDENP